MKLDLACLAVLVLAAAAGALQGILPQLSRLAGAAAGWAGARWLAPSLMPLVHGRVPAFAAHPIASVAAFAVCAVAGALALRLVLAAAGAGQAVGGGADRGLGALAGGAQAALFLWVALSALAIWGQPVHAGPLRLDPRGSDLVGFAREHSALGEGGGRAGRP
jgi:membrane protein required for colicin V production